MGIKTYARKTLDQIHKDIKKEHKWEWACPQCSEVVGKYTHDYIKEKGELFCENCNDVIPIDIEYIKK